MVYENPVTREGVLQAVTENDVKFIRTQFTDTLGMIKSWAIPAEDLEDAFEDGVMFDGSSIEGFTRIEESDMILMPDPTTFRVLPWRPKEGAVARIIGDVFRPNGKPFEGDPRYVLKQAVAKAELEVPRKQSGGAVRAILTNALEQGMIDAIVTVVEDPWTLRPSSAVITSSEVLFHHAGSRYNWWVPLVTSLKEAVIARKYTNIAVVGVPLSCRL